MKTVSFVDYKIGRKTSQTLLELDTARDGTQIGAGLNLIVAPNGKGKTTFLQTMASVLPALGGEPMADGKSLPAGRDVLYVSEYLSFPKFIYPMEWVDFMSTGAGIATDLAPWIEGFALGPKMKSFLGRMSQGERRKVTWLGAHASRKPMLLLDEPLDGLDLLAIKTARAMVSEWRKEGRVVLVVAHQVGELIDLADEVWLIRDRKLLTWEQAIGAPRPQALPAEEFRAKVLKFYGG
jgi:ABC-type multidrug transport system ATPase subunit